MTTISDVMQKIWRWHKPLNAWMLGQNLWPCTEWLSWFIQFVGSLGWFAIASASRLESVLCGAVSHKNTGDRYRYNGMTFANVYLDTMRKASPRPVSVCWMFSRFITIHRRRMIRPTRAGLAQSVGQQLRRTKLDHAGGNGFTDGRGQNSAQAQQSIADFYPAPNSP
jgi:hypothetical protein